MLVMDGFEFLCYVKLKICVKIVMFSLVVVFGLVYVVKVCELGVDGVVVKLLGIVLYDLEEKVGDELVCMMRDLLVLV